VFCNKCKSVLVFALFPCLAISNKVCSTPNFKGNAMKAKTESRADTASDINRLHDLALRRAHELRQDAIGEFWRGANTVLASTADAAERSARRLAQRLSRHARRRGQGGESLSTHTTAG
jgi:hypothetical protein